MSQEATSLWSWWWSTSDQADETYRNILTTIVLLLVIFWFIFSIRRQNEKKLPLPPRPRGLPLVGYLPFLGSNLHQSFKELASIYGPIFKVQLGIKEYIVVTSPSLVKEVVRDQDITFANRGDPTVAARSVLFGTMDIGFSDYGFEWRKMRKIFVSQMMSHASLDATYHLRKLQVKKMMYETCEKAGQLVDIGELTFFTIVSSVLSMIWGDTLKGDKSSIINAEFRAVIAENVELLGAPNISDLFPLLAWFDLQGIERKMKMISLRCENILDAAICHYNTAETNEPKDFLGHLLQLTKLEDPATSLTLPQVKAILLVDFSEKFGIVVKKSEPLIAVPSPRLSFELYSYKGSHQSGEVN
ncbi:hypothetical protein SOVF_022410 [Spinacia oleracea]|nr:hypothetical protein SOVF_022410 [Spinacia oleracea]